jgi:hypothetical protein
VSEKSRQQVWDVFAEALKIFDAKNADYGDAWRKHGWRGNLPRIFEKTERVKELLWRDHPRTPAVGDETAVETLVDMLNSLAFTIINLREGVEYGHELPASERSSAWSLGADSVAMHDIHGEKYMTPTVPAHYFREDDGVLPGHAVVVDPVVLDQATEQRLRPMPDDPQA